MHFHERFHFFTKKELVVITIRKYKTFQITQQ